MVNRIKKLEEKGERGRKEEGIGELWEDKDWRRVVVLGRGGRGTKGWEWEEKEGTDTGGREGGGKWEEGIGKEEVGKGGEREKTREDWKVCFWNVGGLGNKDKDFWDGLDKWDVVVLIETWMDKRGWKRRSKKMPKGFKWGIQLAGRRNRKGRTMGGLMMGIKWDLVEKGEEIPVRKG